MKCLGILFEELNKRYQCDFPKAVVLKGSTIGSISSSFRRGPCQESPITGKIY